MSGNDSDVQILQIIDEFIVDVDKVDLIKRYQSKLERMYNVHVGVEDLTNEEGTKQWIMVEGDCGDRKDAKEYILAICSPNESHKIEFPPFIGLFTEENLEEIEKQTNAFIVPSDDKQSNFQVCGSDLAVTLALSMMEEMFNKHEDNVEEDGQVDNKSFHQGLSPEGPSSRASERLSMKLERALSEHSDGTINVNDYSHAPESAKRVIVQCLHENFVEDDIDEDQLFADGEKKDRKDSAFQKARSGHISIFHDNKALTPEAKVMDVMETDQPAVGSISEKLTNTLISNYPPSSNFRKEHEYLRNLGVSVGYKQAEIEDALKCVNEKTRPSDFLDLLNKMKEKTDTELEISPGVSVDKMDNSQEKSLASVFNQNFSTPPSPMNSPFKRDLPGNYIELLQRDFLQEDTNCSREELIRRNAERQKLLKHNFMFHVQQQQNKQVKSKKKGKSKKKKDSGFGEKKTREEQPSHPENKQEGNEIIPVYDTQLDKEASNIAYEVIDLCDSFEDNAEDETCLMKAWRPEKPFIPQAFGPAAIKDNGFMYFQPTQQMYDGKCANNFPPPYQVSQTQIWGNGPREVSPFKGAYSAPVAKQCKYQPKKEDELRYIVIDGSNVAMSHGNRKVFSCKGIEICVNFFKKRGHKVLAFVPQWRTCRPTLDNPIKDQEVLQKLQEDGTLVYTPSRRIGKRWIVSYDDRFILELAEHEDGIIVSNDQYRDLMLEKVSWKRIIEERLLLYSFAGDLFMPPADPLGRNGPTLDEFLRKPRQTRIPLSYTNRGGGNQQIPRKYDVPPLGYQNIPPPGYNPIDGTFHHSENFPQGGTNNIQQNFSAAKGQMNHINRGNAPRVQGQKHSQRSYDTTDSPMKSKHSRPRYYSASSSKSARSQEMTEKLYGELKQIFPEPTQDEKIKSVLSNHCDESDITKLAAYCTNVFFE